MEKLTPIFLVFLSLISVAAAGQGAFAPQKFKFESGNYSYIRSIDSIQIELSAIVEVSEAEVRIQFQPDAPLDATGLLQATEYRRDGNLLARNKVTTGILGKTEFVEIISVTGEVIGDNVFILKNVTTYDTVDPEQRKAGESYYLEQGIELQLPQLDQLQLLFKKID